MEIVALVLAVLVIVFQVCLGVSAYFVLRFALARASEWHVKQGGKPLSKGWQIGLSVLSAIGLVA